jgi:hypothetical protein
MRSHSRSKLHNGENIFRNAEIFFSFEKGYIPKEIMLPCYYRPLLVNRVSQGEEGHGKVRSEKEEQGMRLVCKDMGRKNIWSRQSL